MSETEIIDKLFLELSQFTKAKTKREVGLEDRIATARDWRIGIAVTPRLRTHNHYRRLAVIRRIYRETAYTREILDLELYDGSGETTKLAEQSSDWMTA